MKFTETCSCGAKFEVAAWARTLDFDDVLTDWRKNHRHDVQRVVTHQGPTTERVN